MELKRRLYVAYPTAVLPNATFASEKKCICKEIASLERKSAVTIYPSLFKEIKETEATRTLITKICNKL